MNKIYFSFIVLLIPSFLMGMQDVLDEARERKKLLEQHIAILAPFVEVATVYHQSTSLWSVALANKTLSSAEKIETGKTIGEYSKLIDAYIGDLEAFYEHNYLYETDFPIADLDGDCHDTHEDRCVDAERCYCKGLQNVLRQNQEELMKLSKRIAEVKKNPAQAVWLKIGSNERIHPKQHIVTGDTTTLD